MVAVLNVEYDWKGVKERPENRVDVILSSALGPPAETGPRWLGWSCPWHHDPVPSLKVDLKNNRWKCFGGCHEGVSHDAYDFLMLYYGMSQEAAYMHLAGINPDPVLPKPTVSLDALPPVPGDEPERIVSLNQLRGCSGTPETLAYFNGRGITQETVREYLLGDETWNYSVRIGRRVIGRTQRHHFIIPHIRPDGTVSAVKCRRDDAWAKDQLPKIEDDLFGTGLEYLNEKYGPPNVTEKVMLDFFFGGRFTQWRGLSGATVFNERLLHKVLPDGTEIWPWLPYVLIVEAEIDALYLRDVGGMQGFPAIALKAVEGIDLQGLLRRAHRVFVIKDNDPDRLNPLTGETTNPGENLAQAVLRKVRRAMLLAPPEISNGRRVKDVNDLQPAEVMAWLRGLGIEPQPRALL